MLPKNHYIGVTITIANLRNFILKEGLPSDSQIYLHRDNFDDIVLEYRNEYKEPLYDPYFLLGVSITEDPFKTVPYNRIGVLEGKIVSEYTIFARKPSEISYETVYRCASCGWIVDSDGRPLSDFEYERKRAVFLKFGAMSQKKIVCVSCGSR